MVLWIIGALDQFLVLIERSRELGPIESLVGPSRDCFDRWGPGAFQFDYPEVCAPPVGFGSRSSHFASGHAHRHSIPFDHEFLHILQLHSIHFCRTAADTANSNNVGMVSGEESYLVRVPRSLFRLRRLHFCVDF